MATTKLCLLFLFLFSSSFISTDSEPDKQSPINVWPKPRNFSWPQPKSANLSSDFTITSPPHKYLTPAVNRYRSQILAGFYQPIVPPVDLIPNSTLRTLTISVADLAAVLQDGVSEAYSLAVPENGGDASLTAHTVWGAMRGLETFSQLVWGDPAQVAAGVSVSDSPMFRYRGVMLDTSRNYYPVEDILRTIRAMSANKLNVFHWHITDSHSFPLVLPSEPTLAEKGSYGPEMQYTPEDVRRIVDFGIEHGVRILPEIDMPGHAGSWAGAYPEIVSCANKFWWPAGTAWEDRLSTEPGTGQLNPLHPNTTQVVINVLRDVIRMFPERLYHGGINEVVPGCWKADPSIQDFLKNNGTLNQVLETFLKSTFDYITFHNRTPIYWEDVMLNDRVNASGYDLSHDTILQTWNNAPTNTKKIIAMGYRVIVSSADFYYLDCGHGDFLGNNSIYNRPPGTDQGNYGGSYCGPFKTWQTVYNYDITYGLSEEEAKNVLGGEVVLWSHQAGPTNLDQRLWPRASAMAEALWSGNRNETGMKRYAEATDRLNEWINRMVARRVKSEPIQPLWCPRNPGMCNTVNSI